MFKLKKIGEKKVYYSDILPCEHFFTTRDLIVKDNIDLISNYLNIKEENLIHPHQTHSDNIKVIQNNYDDYNDIDSLILDKNNFGIYLNFADCTPIILYDLKNNIGAIAHCGWRGTAKKLAFKTVLKMKELYQTNPKDIVALIGPCISFNKFETYKEALDLLKKSVKNQEGLFKDNFADLKGINKRQLEELGVEKIDVCPFCTILDNDKFFSYRKENKTKNRHSAVLKIN